MRILLRIGVLPLLLLLSISFSISETTIAQIVNVGQGSYTTTLTEGRNLPSGANGEFVTPRVAEEFDQLVQSNDYWSNLIYPHQGSDHLNQVFIHPLTMKSSANGFRIGYLNKYSTTSNQYLYSSDNDIQIGIEGISSNQTTTYGYGDWTFTAKMEFEDASLITTTGHGLPYTFFDVTGGDIKITSSSTFSVWHNVDEVLGLAIDGVYYALFAPSGSVWSGTQTFTSSLNDKGFLSIAILPDNNSETLEFYRKHAYAQVTNSSVSWIYDENNADLTSTFTYETVLRDSSEGNIDQTLTALYRHQWLNTSDILTDFSYVSPRGEMKVFEGNTFSTSTRFSGILPALPDVGEYDRIQLREFVNELTNETLPVAANTYNSGKQMGRFAEVVHIADQLGAVAERDYLLNELKLVLEEWFTVGGPQEYYYSDTWNTLFGYPESFGSSTEINDHHFHWAYVIKAAATIAQYDSAWASQENWGGMVNLLIRDANNWDRDDTMLPFLRNFDAYAGHSWASGHADYNFNGFLPGNNQESSSESMNFASASILWGEITGQEEIRDLGIFLYANENEAIDQYWFDVDDEVFPDNFPFKAVGRVWGTGADHNTWFGSEPEFIHGINFLPINSGSFYLGKHPEYIIENYNEIVSERGGDLEYWEDVFWQYLAMSDADLALSYYLDDPNYQDFDGETQAHTMHWLYNMKEMGHYNTDVTSDIPTYAVFVNAVGDTTYTAYNAASTSRLVTFSDGFSINVPAKTLLAHQTGESDEIIPPAPVPTIETNLVMSLFSDSYPNFTNVNLDPSGDQNTLVTVEVFDGNNTLKYDSLDFQSITVAPALNVESRSTFHIDYYTSDATTLQLTFIAQDQTDATYEFAINTDIWQSIEIPLATLSDSVDLSGISRLLFTGNGTVYLDNIYFSGDTPVEIDPTESGPAVAAPNPISDPEDVISIFSDAYNDLPNTNFSPNWNQTTEVSFIEIEGNAALRYSDFNYQGTQLGNSIDVTEMEWFHLDYWTNNTSEVNVYLISPGPVEISFTIDVEPFSWQSIDIPLTEYAAVVDLKDVFQLKISGNDLLYLDNLYFAKSPDLSVAPTPVHEPSKVVSLFSNHYDNIVVDTWSATWDQADLEEVTIQGDDALYYTDVNFAGVEFFRTDQIDGTDLTHLHLDMWTADLIDSTTKFNIELVDFGANGGFGGGDDVKHIITFDKSNTEGFLRKEWISFDIPLIDFVNMTTRANLSQILYISRDGIDNFYIDNLYFYEGDATSSEEIDLADVPSEVKLQQNYPNPFNPSTNIQFSIPKTSDVSLSIYNSIGQKVATLVDSRLQTGIYTMTWDASQVSSGVYFYQLKTGGITATKQMLLIK